MSASDSVAYAGLAAGVICFLMYVGLTALAALASLRKPPAPEKLAARNKASHAGAAAALVPDIGETTDLLKAVAQLSDSLSKATPSLVALIRAILFLLVASIASGALHGSPPASEPKAAAATAPPGTTASPSRIPKT